tara:strand:+ start:359 stop:838 length:480 start_codon:yes stop_codon:yes gene_type:complete
MDAKVIINFKQYNHNIFKWFNFLIEIYEDFNGNRDKLESEVVEYFDKNIYSNLINGNIKENIRSIIYLSSISKSKNETIFNDYIFEKIMYFLDLENLNFYEIKCNSNCLRLNTYLPKSYANLYARHGKHYFNKRVFDICDDVQVLFPNNIDIFIPYGIF